MRLAYSSLACPAWTVEGAVAAVARYGYDGIEWRLADAASALCAIMLRYVFPRQPRPIVLIAARRGCARRCASPLRRPG